MFDRANAKAGTSVTLHALRHTAAYRMSEDPSLPLTDVQFVPGHAQLTSTRLYLTPRKEVVIRRLLAHHAEQTASGSRPRRPASGSRLSAGKSRCSTGAAPQAPGCCGPRVSRLPHADSGAGMARRLDLVE
ncbi:tyrosine-type recombinase/integrase [Streptomyces sp. NPDC002928]|uniref:tyrosine-type recombinase/integrase n=1 Tax=Streptomyces sp. NPDC002928 TaxID=3154440 RepID=UPI0033B591AF